ncbi:MAG: nitroreductase family protein [Sphaerochaetaceae bacterium]|jgi:nitroreductase|nr:nitroreductase family protein [Sphaerochaetaceae bacterium]
MDRAIEVMMKRRSTRNFLAEQIPEESLQKILAAGLQAATAMNRQSWHLTVVQDAQLLDAISQAVGAVLVDSGVPSLNDRAQEPEFHTFYQAPTVVFVSTDGSAYSLADCANATQNMTLAATALDLGSCYIGSFVQAFKHKQGKELLNRFSLPIGYRPVFAVALGYDSDPSFEIKTREWKVSYIR